MDLLKQARRRLAVVGRDARFAATVAARRPFQLLVQVTNRCNMRCTFCDFWPNGAPRWQELTVAEHERLAGELAELGTCLVSIEGGEPFVRPDLVEIVRAYGARHVPLLYTNGWYVDERSARALFAAGLAQVGVSIDFPDAARHDAKRGLAGAWDRAWRAVRTLRDAAPGGGAQVHVMTVLLEDNRADLERLLEASAQAGVGHCLTLVSTSGFRRGRADLSPAEPVGPMLADLWRRHRHLRAFRSYLDGMDAFLGAGPGPHELPRCTAGAQSFNVDHVGNVSPCIEKIDRPVGNVRREPLAALVRRMAGDPEVARCQDCWTLCRGVAQALGDGGTPRDWADLATRMRS